MRYSMASPSSATQGRCNSVQLQGWTRGDGGGTAPYRRTSLLESRPATGLPARIALRQSCDEGWQLPWRVPEVPCMPRMVGEISESFGAWLMLLSSAWEPRTGLWRGEGICSVYRMNPVHADHLRAHSALTRREGSQRLKESTAAPSWPSLAVVPIGCCRAQNPDDEVRVAGVDGSFRRACGMHMYRRTCVLHVYVWTALCPLAG